jgi:hypothetical protein
MMMKWILGASAFVALMLLACADEPNAESRVVVAPLDEPGYASVHPVLVRSCGGTADCHGREPRGLRVYGEGALRLPGAVGPTTANEIRATYTSILGLEPEKLTSFVSEAPRSADDARKLLLLAKPLTLERHAPALEQRGIALRQGESAEQCILSWLLGGPVDQAACSR